MMKKVIVTIVILLLSFLTVLTIFLVTQTPECHTMYPPPTWKVESPQNNTVIYNTDNINLSLKVESDYGYYDYYYSIDVPVTLDDLNGKVPINSTLISEKPINPWRPWDKHQIRYTCQSSIQVQNLTVGQHAITLYYSYDDFILDFWKHVKPSETIILSIGNVESTPTPTPTVPEFSWLMILPFLSVLFFVVLIRKRKLNDGYD
jgi:hypothetical protein